MTDTVLTSERILETAEDVLRRFGPAKATVVDVARALGVSHGSVYRHFPSKAALRDAVAERWLARISEPLEAVARRGWPGARAAPSLARPPDRRQAAAGRSRTRSCSRPTSSWLPSRGTSWWRTSTTLTGQLAAIIADGVARGEFADADPAMAGRAVFDATARFHNPAHAAEWSDPGIDAAFEGVWSLVVAALRPRRRAH